jgi:MerR family transcriptional regulator, light-induced transcriptional regulator
MTPSEPTRPVPAADTATIEQLADEFLERFSAGDRHAVVVRTRSLLRGGTPATQLRHAVARTQHRVGELWETGRWTVTQEHVATSLAEAAIAAIDDARDLDDTGGEPSAADARSRARVAVVAADGEWHGLAARLTAQALTGAGLQVVELGAALPADDLGRSLPALKVDALAVSVTLGSNLLGAARSVEAGRDLDVPVLLGGRAATPRRAELLGAHGYAEDGEHGAELLTTWLTDGAPMPPRPDLDLATAAAVRRRRDDLVAAAYAGVEDRWPSLRAAPERTIDRIIEDLELLVDHAAAALLVRDDRLLADQLPWLHAVHEGRGLPKELLDAEVAALLAADPGDAALVDLLARCG